MKKNVCLFMLLLMIFFTGICLAENTPATPTPEKAREYHRRFEQGADLFQHGRYADALKIFDSVISEEPKAPYCLFMAGNACIFLFEFDKAISYLDRFLELSPDNPQALIPLIVCYQSTGKTDKAQELIDKLRTLKQTGKFLEVLGPMERFQRELMRLPDGLILAGIEYFHNDPSRPVFAFDEETADYKITREYQIYHASDAFTDLIRKKKPQLKDVNIYLFQEADYKDGIPTDPKIYQILTELPTYTQVRQWVLDARTNPPTPINTPPSTDKATPATPSKP